MAKEQKYLDEKSRKEHYESADKLVRKIKAFQNKLLVDLR